MSNLARRLPWLALLLLSAAVAVPGDADAQCSSPGQTCGLFGGSCCSGSSCVVGICVANCAGEGGVCLTSSGCCGSRVCALGFCQTPRTLGQACGPGFPCASGLSCDPLAGFTCVRNADLGEACGPGVACNPGLVCDPLAGLRCVSQTAQLGEACGPLVQCAGGLVCDPLAGFRCVDQTASLGQACGPLVQCRSGLVCDPFAGFVCVDQSAGEGQACGPLVQCDAGLVCDPLAGFQCVPATTPDLGEACGPLFPCADGLVCDPLAGLRCVSRSSGESEGCGPLVQCQEGFFCDPLAGFRCVPAAGVDQACGPGVPCQAGLQCTAAFRCAHAPARAGETCGVGSGCDDGLYCQLGLPSRCQELRKPGEGCSAFNPCVADASCQPCFVDGCNAPLQCFPNGNEGAISEQTCRVLHSPALAKTSQDIGLAMTYAVGNEAAILVGEAQSFGVGYGQDGSYGCFTTLCGGINVDFSIEHFVSVGFYRALADVGGASFATFQEVEIPGDLLQFSTSQVLARDPGTLTPRVPLELIGTEDALSVGISPEFALPFSAGAFACETVLDTVIPAGAPGGGSATGAPPTLAVASPALGNPGFTFDLGGWRCVGAGACARSQDDVSGKESSGSGEVTSPTPGVDPGIAHLASSCVGVTPGQPLEISAWVKTLGARAGTLLARWNAGLACDGPLAESDTLGVSPPDATWREIRVQRQVPGSAQSVQLLLSAERDAGSGAASTSRIDIVRIPEPGAGLGAAAGVLALAGLARRRLVRSRRRIRKSTVAAALLGLLASGAGAEPVVDSEVLGPEGIHALLGEGRDLAQTLRIRQGGVVTRVDLGVSLGTTSPVEDDLVFDLREATPGGAPAEGDLPVLDTRTLPAAAFPTFLDPFEFTAIEGLAVAVAPGDSLAIALRIAPPVENLDVYRWALGPEVDSLPGATGFCRGAAVPACAAGWSALARDFQFRLWVDPDLRLDASVGDPPSAISSVRDGLDLAQSFTVLHTGMLERIDLKLQGSAASPADYDLAVDIRPVGPNGIPVEDDGAALAQRTLAMTELPDSLEPSRFTVLEGLCVPVEAGDRLAIVLRAVGVPPGVLPFDWFVGPAGNPHPGGSRYCRGTAVGACAGGWTDLGGDFQFRALIAVPEPGAEGLGVAAAAALAVLRGPTWRNGHRRTRRPPQPLARARSWAARASSHVRRAWAEGIAASLRSRTSRSRSAAKGSGSAEQSR